jgi:hypothetical protein
MGKVKNAEEFTELADFALGGKQEQGPQSSHNVIKRNQVVRKGVQEVGMDEKHPDDPLVYVQREGDHVTQIDFLCKCGRSASLRLEYDEE